MPKWQLIQCEIFCSLTFLDSNAHFFISLIILCVSRAASENPAHWARVCLRNMANIAKEATTVRRILDPLFRLFDSHNYWSPESGVALSVLQEMQTLMDKSGAAIFSHVISSLVFPFQCCFSVGSIERDSILC